MAAKESHIAIENKIRELEDEIAFLKSKLPEKPTVKVPDGIKDIFDQAQQTVKSYFSKLELHPEKGTIEVNDQRYVLIRASALSDEFFRNINQVYSEKTADETFNIARNFLFDFGHLIGKQDAKRFHEIMHLKEPISKLSAGPVHFAYSGWAFVDILPESKPQTNEDFFMKYHHPYSFEADSWLKNKVSSNQPVCVMNAAYSSGWCEESYGIPLTAVEITCRAKGDKNCTFIMAHPSKIEGYLDKELQTSKIKDKPQIPFFFERKKIEDKLIQNEKILTETLNEKEILLKEVHHRVKNNLQIITSLLNLQSSFFSTKELYEPFQESQNRIKSIAAIHELLYQSSDLASIEFNEYLKKLSNDLIYSYHGIHNQIQVNIDAPFKFNIDTAIPLGLLINEIISNSLKHGLSNSKNDQLFVTISSHNKLDYKLLIGDNGKGFEMEPFSDKTESLGLMLIRELSNQLNGEIEKVKTKKGTEYRLLFKENETS